MKPEAISAAIDNIAARAEKAATENGVEEYLDPTDGLLHCSKCKEPTQCRVMILNEMRTVRCICKCVQDQKAREEKERRKVQRDQKIQRMRIKGFDRAELQNWTFDRDDGGSPKITAAAKRYCAQFEHFKANGKGLLFYGTVGTGKTFTAACIANELISKGTPVLMTNFSKIINRLQGSFEGRQEYLDSLSEFDLIIIDDLAAERNTEFVNEIVYTVIDARYRSGLPMIITTNIDAKKMMNETEQARQRIYSRIIERCHPIEVKANDRRQEKAFEDFAEMQRLLGM